MLIEYWPGRYNAPDFKGNLNSGAEIKFLTRSP